tara:strand:- start:187 stop:351 length:165 start_codon:yes stop_codon:yes gene_type:complete
MASTNIDWMELHFQRVHLPTYLTSILIIIKALPIIGLQKEGYFLNFLKKAPGQY